MKLENAAQFTMPQLLKRFAPKCGGVALKEIWHLARNHLGNVF
jgi:hypothetical protein